ncbi:hypothetical protein LC612_30595 [Nostoc sp. CHAB 5834]|nr:hypothetical protein [Nostoc sp. CHAB 5834]
MATQRIFVFGSNRAGIHGKGDALIARRAHGAVLGQGEGLQGQSYGIPTKDENIRALPLSQIERGVARFLSFAKKNPEMTFMVQAIGCKNAGYNPAQIAPFFLGAPANCMFHELFIPELNSRGHKALAISALPPPGQVELF